MVERLSETDARRGYLRTAVTPDALVGMTAVADFAVVTLTGLSVYIAYVGWHADSLAQYMTAILIMAGLTSFAFRQTRLYEFETIARTSPRLLSIFTSLILVFLFMATAATALKVTEDFSRVWFFATIVISSLTISAFRVVLAWQIQQLGWSSQLAQRVAVFGATIQASELIQRIGRQQIPWLHLSGVFDDKRPDQADSVIDQHLYAGDLNRLMHQIRMNQIDQVLIALPWSDDQRIKHIAERLSELPVKIALVSDMVGFQFRAPNLHMSLGVPMLNVSERPIEGWEVILKALEDRILGALFLLAFGPMMLAIALAIKLDSRGPVLFKQRRNGYNNEEIVVWKFRTMRDGSEKDPLVAQATRDDPRVTRVGRTLRRTSLDELPQLFNVLQGRMSLVGPRPHAVQHNEQYSELISGYNFRHKMKPGMTGWAQVCGHRGETASVAEMEERVKCDAYYVENWSLAFDMIILLRTVGVLLHRKAY